MLALPQLMAIAGAFPQRVGGEPANYTLGMIQSFAGRSGAFGAPPADGRLLPVPDNQPLMAVIGLTFGGDGLRLALPDLRSRAPIGGQQIGLPGQHSLGMTYLIATAAESGAPMLGMVVAFGGNFAPPGWTVADGRMLPISANVPLYQLIGQIFGGSPVAFNLPNLDGFAVIGAGDGPGLEPIALGGHVAQPVPALALNYLINIDAAAPPGGGTGGFPESGSWLGQVIAYAGSDMPLGWAACDGALLDAATYPALFALLGTQYGGDASRFALPDLRGRILIGA
jgi:microcystin-dependent protein